MRIDERLDAVLNDALEGCGPSRADCAYMLQFPELSLEAAVIAAAADVSSRQRFRNEAVLLGQIGIDIAPCPADCAFCAFGERHTHFTPRQMAEEEVLRRAHEFTSTGDLYALFLMTMHTFDPERLLSIVRVVRGSIPSEVRIVVNIGDFTLEFANDLADAGVDGAYHVLRLREGQDTKLAPEDRMATIEAIRSAGLDWYYCCEPVGPEHTPEEIVEQIFIGVDGGCFQHAAMRRVYSPASPLARYGQISERRLAQVVAVVALASLNCPQTRSIAVHEPNLLGLAAGANSVYAETGSNPRDLQADTSGHRGVDVAACRRMSYEAGFEHVLRGDGGRAALSYL
jgi:biotin synthase